MPINCIILSSKEIDQEKWNNCLINSENGLIYSRYEYLDHICDNWHALVIDDYKAVMALPWRSKFGIRYLYEPPFTQQLGLIGETSFDALKETFLFAKYGDILFNYSNTSIAEKTGAGERVNLILDLSKGYNAIAFNYKKDLQNNLKKALRDELCISTEVDINTAADLFYQSYQSRFPHVSSNDFIKFKLLCAVLERSGMCLTRKVFSSKGDLLAIALFLKDEKRIYNMMNTTTELGRSTEANHFLLDAVIKEFSGQKLIFDFEGSDLPGVKTFYEKFGAVNQPYYHLHFNRLPLPLRLLKR